MKGALHDPPTKNVAGGAACAPGPGFVSAPAALFA
jgi:hypothetical protein